jgi:hypothetical protein
MGEVLALELDEDPALEGESHDLNGEEAVLALRKA